MIIDWFLGGHARRVKRAVGIVRHFLKAQFRVLYELCDFRHDTRNVVVKLLSSIVVEQCLAEASGTQRAQLLDKIVQIVQVLINVLLDVDPLWR